MTGTEADITGAFGRNGPSEGNKHKHDSCQSKRVDGEKTKRRATTTTATTTTKTVPPRCPVYNIP